jgi:hypothetical protein
MSLSLAKTSCGSLNESVVSYTITFPLGSTSYKEEERQGKMSHIIRIICTAIISFAKQFYKHCWEDAGHNLLSS